MIVRVTVCRMREDVEEREIQAFMAAFREAVLHVPGLIGFQVGQRLPEHAPFTPSSGPGAKPRELAAIFQFDTLSALHVYERRPAHAELMKRLEVLVESQVSGDFEM